MFTAGKAAWLVLLLPMLVVKKPTEREYVIRGYAQGTDYTVRYFAQDSMVSKGAVDSLLLGIDRSMSLYRSDSRIQEFNASSTGVIMDAHLEKVMRKAFEINKASRGLFDPTVAPLVQLWGFGPKPVTKFPDSTTVSKTLGCVGMKYLSIRDSKLVKSKPCVTIDLNGIAQGYSVDVVADHLRSRGLRSFLVEIGGEIVVGGPKPDGSLFSIAIEKPVVQGDSTSGRILRLKAGAMTTSGNYRRHLQNNGNTISHLINPATGYPLQNGIISVTVLASDAMTADGYDNALMATSVPAALKLVGNTPGMAVYIIYRNEKGEMREAMSPGFKRLLKF